MFIKQNYNSITDSIPDKVELVAVSKTKPLADIMDAYDHGHRAFGENKVQEMVQKHEELPKDIEWHMIGHLQRNKVKYMAPFVHLIHGVDSLKTLIEINKQAIKHDRTINCLLQVRIAREETKFGLTEEELREVLNSDIFKSLSNIKIKGLMGMASFSEDMDQVRSEFTYLSSLYRSLLAEHSEWDTLSMGMSGDYDLAIECGSTLIRVGSALFGARNYLA